MKVESPAAEVLRGLDSDLQADLVALLEELETDPYLQIGGSQWRETKPFQELRRAGFDIRILKAREIRKWRIFYFVDSRRRTVLVKEVVPRDDYTYEMGSAHVRRLRRNFLMYQGRG